MTTQRVGEPSIVTVPELFDWLRRHELDPKDVYRVEFISRSSAAISSDVADAQVYLRVERRLRDGAGKWFLVREAGEDVPATELLLLPLRGLPGQEAGA